MRKLVFILSILFILNLHGQDRFTLEEALDYALQSHNAIKMAQLDVVAAEGQVKEYKAIGMPKLTASFKYQPYLLIPSTPTEDFLTPTIYGILAQEGLAEPFSGTPNIFEFTFNRRHNVFANLDFSVLLFDGSYLSGLKAAKLYRELEKQGITVEEQTIRSEVTRAYMNILIAEENKKILEKNIGNVHQALTETQAFYENGFVEQLDVDRLELSLQNLETEAKKMDRLIEISYNLLKYQMNYPLEEDIVITEDLGILVNRFKIMESQDMDVPVDFSMRAEYDQFLTSQALNELNITRLKRTSYPSLALSANLSQSIQREKLFDGNEVGWIDNAWLSLGLTLPIFDGNLRRGQLQQARVDYDRNEIRKEEFERSVTLQVSNVRKQWYNAIKTLENRDRALAISEDIYNKTRIKFVEGVGSSVEVTQAESALYEAQANQISALYDLLIAKTELDIALGQL